MEYVLKLIKGMNESIEVLDYYLQIHDGLVRAVEEKECNHTFSAQDVSHSPFQFFLI